MNTDEDDVAKLPRAIAGGSFEECLLFLSFEVAKPRARLL